MTAAHRHSRPTAVTLDWKWFATFSLALIINAGGTVWWAATMEGRVTALEAANSITQVTRPVALDRLTRVESSAADIKERLNRIEGKLDALISSPDRR